MCSCRPHHDRTRPLDCRPARCRYRHLPGRHGKCSLNHKPQSPSLILTPHPLALPVHVSAITHCYPPATPNRREITSHYRGGEPYTGTSEDAFLLGPAFNNVYPMLRLYIAWCTYDNPRAWLRANVLLRWIPRLR